MVVIRARSDGLLQGRDLCQVRSALLPGAYMILIRSLLMPRRVHLLIRMFILLIPVAVKPSVDTTLLQERFGIGKAPTQMAIAHLIPARITRFPVLGDITSGHVKMVLGVVLVLPYGLPFTLTCQQEVSTALKQYAMVVILRTFPMLVRPVDVQALYITSGSIPIMAAQVGPISAGLPAHLIIHRADSHQIGGIVVGPKEEVKLSILPAVRSPFMVT